jgi:hypothetical protein
MTNVGKQLWESTKCVRKQQQMKVTYFLLRLTEITNKQKITSVFSVQPFKDHVSALAGALI